MAKRREFLKGIGVAAASGLAINKADGQTSRTISASNTVSALPPSHYEETMETEVPEGYTDEQANHYFVQSAGSDYMVDVIKSLGIDYIASNPGSSFRGLQESIAVYGGNKQPEFLTCLHEESAVAMSHGYAKIAYKPMAVVLHGTVGLQHAAMAVYNAYCDRVPMVIFAGNHMEASNRRLGVEWAHSALDCVNLVRDFIKWDDTPLSLAHYSESLVRAYKIAVTPPMAPVVIQLDGHLQEEDTHGKVPPIPKFTPPQPPHGDIEAMKEAARILVNAQNPVILAGIAARTPAGMEHLVELAEALQAPVSGVDRMNFPNDHYLAQGGRGLIQQADVILGLEKKGLFDSVNSMQDLVHRKLTRVARDDVKLVSLSSEDLFMKSNYQNFQRLQPVDLDIIGDAEASLPYLIEEVKRQMPRSRRSQLKEREEKYRASYQKAIEQAKNKAAASWNSRPVSLERLSMEVWDVIKDRDWSLVSWAKPAVSNLWTMNRHYHQIGGSGGAGQGYSLPSSVGAALANREHGRFSVAIQKDGDFCYAPGVIWTAAHHRIPLLWVMHNNRAYHMEVMHTQRMGLRRQRGAQGQAKIGTVLEDPFIDFSTVAKGFGVYSEGPITNPDDLGPALKRAAAIVDSGYPALVDVVCQP